MQDFNVECTINLHVEAYGKPAKYIWCCSLCLPESRIIFVSGFVGRSTKREAEDKAILFGLEQAHRLRQEKVAISASFPLEGRPFHGEGGRKKLPLSEELFAGLWEAFRLRKTAPMGKEEREFLSKEARKNLRNK